MYSYDDIKNIEKEIKRFLLYFAIGTVVFIAVLIAVCRNWGTILDPYRLPAWPAYVVGVLYAVGAVFSWSMIGIRLIKYRRFVYNMLTGLDHELEGTIVSVDTNLTYDNDLEFYSIEIKENGAEASRLLHLDAVKDIEIFEKDKNVRLMIFGNYIKDILS